MNKSNIELLKSDNQNPFYIAVLPNGDIFIVHFEGNNDYKISIHASKKPLIIGNFKNDKEDEIIKKINNFYNLENIKNNIAKSFNKIDLKSTDQHISNRIKNIEYRNIEINTSQIDSIFEIDKDKYVIFLLQ